MQLAQPSPNATTHATATRSRSMLDSTEPTIIGEPTADLDGLRVRSLSGGLVLLGPTAAPLGSLDALLNTPNTVPVEVNGKLLASWTTSPDELVLLTRQVSRIIRDGKTAVVYLDSHRAGVEQLPIDVWDFVCLRLGSILIGLAETPAYVTVHGQDPGVPVAVTPIERVIASAVHAVDWFEARRD